MVDREFMYFGLAASKALLGRMDIKVAKVGVHHALGGRRHASYRTMSFRFCCGHLQQNVMFPTTFEKQFLNTCRNTYHSLQTSLKRSTNIERERCPRAQPMIHIPKTNNLELVNLPALAPKMHGVHEAARDLHSSCARARMT